ncbi:MAG TPA: ABC transporter transmembrane domain-containing protein, partial [Tepidisphaeraceae bacterium]
MAQDHALEEEVFTGRFDFSLWRKVFVFAKPYRKLLIALGSMGALVAVFDVTFPLITGSLVDSLMAHDKTGSTPLIGAHLLAYGSVVVLFTLCIFSFIVVAGRITTGVSHDIRKAAFEKLQELPFSFYDRKAVGWLMARLTSDCNNLSRVMGWALLDICWGTSVITLVTVAMFILSWRVALVVVLIIPPLAFICRYFQVKLLLTNRALRKANSQTTAAFNEGILGVRTTKSMVREVRNLEEFSTLADTMYKHASASGLYEAMFLPIVLSICAVGIGLALWRGGVEVTIGGLTLGKLVAFLQYAGFLQHPAQELAHAITMVQGAQASAERVQGLLDTDVEIADSTEVIERIRRTCRAEGIAMDGHRDRIDEIEFRNVTFSYKAGQTVLKNFNLTVRAGETIALVGPTGGGKTTIVGLACRFYEPTSG